jgi:hypothetical protein
MPISRSHRGTESVCNAFNRSYPFFRVCSCINQHLFSLLERLLHCTGHGVNPTLVTKPSGMLQVANNQLGSWVRVSPQHSMLSLQR